MNSVIEEIFRTNIVQDERGNEYELHSGINQTEGEFIFQLINSNPHILKTLEVGCAYGMSSLYICSALAQRNAARHLIIDPFQYDEWHGIGLCNLKKAGFNQFELIEKPSEYSLPEIAQKEPFTFDMVFIDGWHTFDHSMIDLFYASRLIKVGGLIVVDDCRFSPVAKAVAYMLNCPAYQLVGRCGTEISPKTVGANVVKTMIPPAVAGHILPRNIYDKYYVRTMYPSMVALKKVEDDQRTWDWFEPF